MSEDLQHVKLLSIFHYVVAGKVPTIISGQFGGPGRHSRQEAASGCVALPSLKSYHPELEKNGGIYVITASSLAKWNRVRAAVILTSADKPPPQPGPAESDEREH
jgi:hypothetical protein